MENKTAPEYIRVEWETGHIELNPEYVTKCSAAKLKKIMQQATRNQEKTAADLRACISAARSAAGEHDKKEAARLKALLAALEEPKKKSPAARVAGKIVKRIDFNPKYAGVFISGGCNCVCDGFTLLCLHESLDLPAVQGGLDAVKTIKEAKQDAAPLKLPTLEEVKSLQRIAKSAPRGKWIDRIFPDEKKVVYNFGGGFPMVDLAFLRDVLEALPGARAYSRKARITPIVFESAAGLALLLPVRPPENAPEIPAEEAPAADADALTPEEFAARLLEAAPAEYTPAEFAASLAA